MTLLFYDDSPVFGGHEVMTLLGLDAILRHGDNDVHFWFSESNAKLMAKLHEAAEKHPRLQIKSLPWHSSKIEGLRNLLKPARARALGRRLKQVSPDLVIAVQGNLEHSSLVLLAASQAGIPCTSYIPVPHSNAAMGAKLGALRDLFCRHLLRVPDSFITITDEMAAMLQKRGVRAPVQVVYNGVDIDRFRPGDRSAAQSAYGLPAGQTILGIMGRIEFRQKQQNVLVDAIASNPFLIKTCHLVVAGDGPDQKALEHLIQRRKISATLLPWTDPAELYPALDALIIPSRYEGLPLVMLEALAAGIAVLGSDSDGMKDILPAEWRFSPDANALAAALLHFIQNGKSPPSPELVTRIRKEMSLEFFQKSFAARVFSLA